MAVGLCTNFAPPSFPLGGSGSSHCHYCRLENTSNSMIAASLNAWIKVAIENQIISGQNKRIADHCSMKFRCKNPLYGASASHLTSIVHNMFLSRVWVAADYSDSLPESSNYRSGIGYHSLEELKEHKRKDKMLTDAEMARTAVQANNKALLVFPGMVHHEPHGYASWAEYLYVVDDYGDIYFEIYDDENIMQDREASNLVNVLIGLNVPNYKANKRSNDDEYESLDIGTDDEIKFEENDHEEGASIIGVDSLGLDVHVYSGTEAKTLRFTFNAPATSESAAEKKIQRMLFPRHHRKSFKPPNDAYRDADSF